LLLRTNDLLLYNSPTYDEKELLKQLLLGSEQAFEKIYKQYSTRLYGNIFKFVKSDADAQEILQDIFLKVWNNRQHIDVERSFRSYLFKIAENQVYDFFRRAARNKKMEARLMTVSIVEYVHIEEMLLNKEGAIFLEKAIDMLPPQRQQVFRLCKLEGKTYREVSELLQISVSTISDHIVKGTKTIRIYFENNENALIILLIITSSRSI
jgi:RNA polymerase sigma-70 factor (ECF subfamily)